MAKPEDRRLVEAEPQLASELQTLLEQAGEIALAAQVDALFIFDRDNYGYGFNIYTAPRPMGPRGPRHRTLGLTPGVLHVDVVGDHIVMIEVLRKNDYTPTARRARPQGQSRDMTAAGLTSEVDESGVRHWYIVGWSNDIGWGVMADLQPFLTRAEAEAAWWRLKAIEDEDTPIAS